MSIGPNSCKSTIHLQNLAGQRPRPKLITLPSYTQAIHDSSFHDTHMISTLRVGPYPTSPPTLSRLLPHAVARSESPLPPPAPPRSLSLPSLPTSASSESPSYLVPTACFLGFPCHQSTFVLLGVLTPKRSSCRGALQGEEIGNETVTDDMREHDERQRLLHLNLPLHGFIYGALAKDQRRGWGTRWRQNPRAGSGMGRVCTPRWFTRTGMGSVCPLWGRGWAPKTQRGIPR